MKHDERAERQFLAKYRAEDFPRPSVAVDVVVLTVHEGKLRVLLVARHEHPFKGKWALPGGFLRVGKTSRDQGEDLDAAAARELEEETALAPDEVFLEQLAAFGKSGRDPRMRVVTIAYFAIVRPDLLSRVKPGGDAERVKWVAIDDALAPQSEDERLAFDHEEIVSRARARLIERLETTSIAKNLVPDPFSIPELRATFEIVSGRKLDRGNFRRKFTHLLETNVVELAPGKRATASKPASVYRFRLAT